MFYGTVHRSRNRQHKLTCFLHFPLKKQWPYVESLPWILNLQFKETYYTLHKFLLTNRFEAYTKIDELEGERNGDWHVFLLYISSIVQDMLIKICDKQKYPEIQNSSTDDNFNIKLSFSTWLYIKAIVSWLFPVKIYFYYLPIGYMKTILAMNIFPLHCTIHPVKKDWIG